jgi:glycosyltransferase involved in cell wall biosynthesis
LPSLEALASGLVNVVPNYGGLLDFCNEKNSLLISGSIVRAPRDHQYWSFNPRAVHFTISTDDAAAKLQHAFKNIESLKESMLPHMTATASRFSWENVGKQIVSLTETR